MRIGFGYDIHRLVKGRRLVLGGETIPFDKGLLGHSDADVLIHAVCDAVLGAAALGDIGMYFPDTDPEYKDISSLFFLKRIEEMTARKGYRVENIDGTIVAEAPKISPYREKMRHNIAQALKIDIDRVSVKATTSEGLGIIGKGMGIGAMCVALIEKYSSHP
ncbi:MAG: 2-C-methyl-D-erythritol 2,4-cyclodiphosphate synthase [Deltaproteobacteria bacterium]|nr:2-C-methyl-D-erythritol 2,4-cyclodiphosphate synthase [Deltaproteobacteria bacterium]MBW1994002.1 2-C-methyl-D-erythritol 2,4-cyclodiphosphate synthase [Deltaproteobacteria bacterium]MBW2152814.1 2-C-methyl-D-erythritol 2,4-cyclodiphosphate synthase [Deltaproteobacteria bacterium]